MARRMSTPRKRSIAEDVLDVQETSVLDVLDHVLTKGVMASGDVTMGVAGIDLIYLRLSAILCAADKVLPLEGQPAKRETRRRPPPQVRR
jgi:gas vesicle structural protein